MYRQQLRRTKHLDNATEGVHIKMQKIYRIHCEPHQTRFLLQYIIHNLQTNTNIPE